MDSPRESADAQAGDEEIPYPEHFEFFIEMWRGSSREQILHILEQKLLGEEPPPLVKFALAFEIGCLHLYLIDHHIRGPRHDDPILNQYWHGIAEALLVSLEMPLTQELGAFIGWRLGRYEDVTRAVEADDTYPTFAAKTDEYLFRIAEQLCLCLSADSELGGEIGIYLGIVNADLLGTDGDEQEALRRRRELFDASQHIKRALFHTSLSLYLAAQLWGAQGTFYKQPLEQLKQAVALGSSEAKQLVETWKSGQLALFQKSWWESRLQQRTFFCFRDEEEFLYEEDGHTYLNLLESAVEEDAHPLGHWLLYAYDLGVGLHTVHTDQELPLQLSLGQVQTLLTRGGFEYFGSETLLPDFENELVVRPVPKWNLSAGSRLYLNSVYQQLEITPSLALIADNQGIKAVVITPCPNEEFLSILQWGIPEETLLVAEPEPNLAQFSLWDLGPDDSIYQGSMVTLPSIKDEWRARVESDEVMFEPTGKYIHGPGGMPMELLRLAPEDEGIPLRALASVCYDNGRGLVVEAPDAPENIVFGLFLGDIIHYLRSGEVFVPRTDEDCQPSGSPTQVIPPRPITALDFPLAACRDLEWALDRIGATVGVCLLHDSEEHPVLVLDSSTIREEYIPIMWERLYVELPVGLRCFLFPLPSDYAFPLPSR